MVGGRDREVVAVAVDDPREQVDEVAPLAERNQIGQVQRDELIEPRPAQSEEGAGVGSDVNPCDPSVLGVGLPGDEAALLEPGRSGRSRGEARRRGAGRGRSFARRRDRRRARP